MASNDLTRLPKWAQAEFADLQRKLARSEEKCEEYRLAIAGYGGSPFSVEHGMNDIPLPSSAEYLTWRNGDFELRLHTDIDRGQLEIMCTSWHGVAVRPRASNVILIGPGRES